MLSNSPIFRTGLQAGLAALALGTTTSAIASGVDENCVGKNPVPYNEQVQVDYLQNAVALASTFSPIHAPVPHEPGHGAIGIELAVIPPLSCKRRFALGNTKTEDTNKSPVLPRPRLSFAFPTPGGVVVPYGGFAFVPPVPVAGTRNTIVSGEAGVGLQLGRWQAGGRIHATLQKTLADVATSMDPDAAPALDLFQASSFGLDLMAGMKIKNITPYVALGYVDVSTFFWIGDDGLVSNNVHPYLGPTFSLGVDAKISRLRLGGEFYGAPGGHSMPDKSFPTEPGFGTYGSMYTARLRVGLEL